MADQPFLASNSFNGDGSTVVWEFSFEGLATDAPLTAKPYIDSGDVKAELITGEGDDQIITPVAFLFETANSIRVEPAVPEDTILRVYRQTENRFPLVNYQDLQSVGASDLDLANRQAVYIVQEARDAARGAGNVSAETLALALGVAQDAGVSAAAAAAAAVVAAQEAATAAEVAALAVPLADLANNANPLLGAGMVGYSVGNTLRQIIEGILAGESATVFQLSEHDVLGDGTDETVALQAVATLFAGQQVRLVGATGKNYVFSGEVAVDNFTFDFAGSTVTLNHSGQVNCFVCTGSGSVVNATIDHNGVVGGGLSGIAQYPILAYNVKGSKFENLAFTAPVLSNRVGIACYGDCENVSVENIQFLGTANWGQGVLFHWLCEDDTVNASALNLTNHPRNLRIRNVIADVFDNAGALVSVVFLSGCYDVEAVNVRADTAPRLMSIIAGDYADEFSTARDAAFVGSSIRVVNPTLRVATNRGMYVEGFGALTTRKVRMGVDIINPTLRGGSSTVDGIVGLRCSGVRISGGKVWGFRYNVAFGAGCLGGVVDGVEITEGYKRGVSVDGGGETITNIRLANNKIHNNNTENLSSSQNVGIYLADAKGCNVANNQFGLLGGPEKQYNSVYILAGCNNISLSNNHTFSAGSVNAYVGDPATPYSMNLYSSNDTSETTNNTAGHVFYERIGFNKRRFVLDGSSGAPASGSWVNGDELVYRSPVASGARGAVCTVTGTPGTWKSFGAISA